MYLNKEQKKSLKRVLKAEINELKYNLKYYPDSIFEDKEHLDTLKKVYKKL